MYFERHKSKFSKSKFYSFLWFARRTNFTLSLVNFKTLLITIIILVVLKMVTVVITCFYNAMDKSAPTHMHVWFITANYWPGLCTTAYWWSVWTKIVFNSWLSVLTGCWLPAVLQTLQLLHYWHCVPEAIVKVLVKVVMRFSVWDCHSDTPKIILLLYLIASPANKTDLNLQLHTDVTVTVMLFIKAQIEVWI